jgi:sugar transferase (PEP-CTERM/EpsH1 system associated)
MSTLLRSWWDDTPYDRIVCFSSSVLPYVLGRHLESKLIVDMVDVDSQKWFDYAERTTGPHAAVYHFEGCRLRSLERAAAESLAIIFSTDIEASLYRQLAPKARILTLFNGVDLEFFRPTEHAQHNGGCVFVGQLDYRANVLGLVWFCRTIWPKVRERISDATLTIVGRNPVSQIRRLGGVPGVEVIGEVPDVRPYLASARVAVVPLPVARGVQNKVLEAMASGLPVVGSPASLEGLSLVAGRDAIVASDAADWSRTLKWLWDDPRRRREIGDSARRYVERHHRWGNCLGGLHTLIGDSHKVELQKETPLCS